MQILAAEKENKHVIRYSKIYFALSIVIVIHILFCWEDFV